MESYSNYHTSPLYNHPKLVQYNSIMTQPIYTGIKNHKQAKQRWLSVPIERRMEIMLKIADLIETKFYYKMLAATIVGQGRSIHEANIDAIQETIDFLLARLDSYIFRITV